jgi:hypothetical protein
MASLCGEIYGKTWLDWVVHEDALKIAWGAMQSNVVSNLQIGFWKKGYFDMKVINYFSSSLKDSMFVWRICTVWFPKQSDVEGFL